MPDIGPLRPGQVNQPPAKKKKKKTPATPPPEASSKQGHYVLTPSGAIWVPYTDNEKAQASANPKDSKAGEKVSSPVTDPNAINQFPDSQAAKDAATKAAGNASAVGQINATFGGRTNRVYFGQQLDESATGPGGQRHAYDDVRTLTTAENDVYTWSDAEWATFGKKLAAIGAIDDPNNRFAIAAAWKSAVDQAAKYYQAGKKLTPWDVVNIKGFSVDGSNPKGSPYANQTISRTQKNTNYIDDSTADGYTRAIFQNTVGRDPTAAEMSRYRFLITGYEKGHPQVSTTTTHYDAHGNPLNEESTTQANPDGTGLQEQMLQTAKADPEYGAYQAATTYYNATMDLIHGSTG